MSALHSKSPWYELVKTGDQLDQGDILFNCPIVEVDESATWPTSIEDVPSVVFQVDVIVMTRFGARQNSEHYRVPPCGSFGSKFW